ncbi:MAG: enterotoxin [Anaeromyxobacter sp.]
MRLPLLAVLALPALAAASPRPWLPLDPGPARCAAGERASLEDAAIEVVLSAADGRLRLASLRNGFTGRTLPLEGELFVLRLKGGAKLPASALRLEGRLACEPLVANPRASRAAERRPGVELRGALRQEGGELSVTFALSLRDGAAHVRGTFTLESPRELAVDRVIALDVALPGATVPGLAEGLPVVAGDVFLALEHPMASPSAVGGRASSTLRRALPLRAGVPATYAAVLGAAPAGQLRRGFAAYLEDERAHPFRTFLHYNSWYDIGYFTPYSEEDALRVIRAYGEELVRKRGAVLDSFLFDDGWDDTAKLWRFHAGFPRGFAPLRAAAAEAGAAPGMWLSPWGGYGPPREARLATAKAAGFEVDPQGLALSGPRYYPYFREAALGLLREQGVNQYKLDGTGSPDKVTPGSAFDSDFAAAIALIEDLRAASPALFVNLTTGTWPSPFWLRWADSIWRGGEDHAFLGAGTDRQRWITYRDADTYGGVVRQSPLFPLNALMLHGIIHARHARGLEGDPSGDLAAEVWTYFASGTGLQELYVSPDTLSPAQWDLLAAAARWARARADVLRDSHWVGGDPARGEPYGWASWSPERAVVALRNPGPGPATYTLDAAAALELPPGAARQFKATAVFGRAPPKAVHADRPVRVPLAPHEVVVWELAPAR